MRGLPTMLPYQNITYQELLLVKTNIAGYFFDGFLDVDHTHTTTITSHPVQTGANISDHAYNEPAEVKLTIKMSDSHEGLVTNQFAGISYTRSTAAYKVLRELQTQRIAFQVHTRLETYQNMMIKSLSVADDLENLYGLEASVTLQQILVSKEKTVKISKRVQTTSTSSQGMLNAGAADSSILRMMLGETPFSTN